MDALAAVWHPKGPAEARALAARVLTRSVTLEAWPSAGGAGVALAASGAARLDAPARFVALGNVEPASVSAVASQPASVLSLERAKQLRGDYGLAAATPEGLLLARGILGGRPVYHRVLPGGAFVASSRLAPLVRLASTTVDVDTLAAFLLCVLTESPAATAHREISRLGCCEILNIAPGGVFRARRAVAQLPVESLGLDADEAAEGLWEHLRRAARRALAGRRRVAVFAGGGLDSSGLLAAAVAEARGASDKEVFAVALHFGGPGDDRPHLRALSAELGIDAVRVDPRDAGRFLHDALVLDAAPYVGAPFDLELPIVARAHGAEIVLSGNYGDELFEGQLGALGREEGLLRALALVARLRVPWRAPLSERVRSYLLGPLLRTLIPSAMRRARTRRTIARALPWAGPRLRNGVRRHRFRVGTPVEVPRTPSDRYATYAMHDRWCDAADARGQVEARTGVLRIDPFQDDELVAFVTSLPTRLHVQGGQHRSLLRRALRRRVPEALRLREDKAAFEPALAEVVRAAGGFGVFTDLASCRELSRLGLVDAEAFRASFARLTATPDDAELGGLWSLVAMTLAAEAFVRAHVAGQFAALETSALEASP